MREPPSICNSKPQCAAEFSGSFVSARRVSSQDREVKCDACHVYRACAASRGRDAASCVSEISFRCSSQNPRPCSRKPAGPLRRSSSRSASSFSTFDVEKGMPDSICAPKYLLSNQSVRQFGFFAAVVPRRHLSPAADTFSLHAASGFAIQN